jgi:glycosyltransferase involved in cell wall biosynthesis
MAPLPLEVVPPTPVRMPRPTPADRTRDLRIVVFTTSYPRHDGDHAGLFVRDLVEHVRASGVRVDVVGPGSYRDFGLTAPTGRGLVGNLRRRPWAGPPAVAGMAHALRRAARHADLVHVNWLAGAVIARLAGRPYVVTLHGSGSAGRFDDLSLAAGAPRLVRWALAPARAVICVSDALAEAVRALGVGNVHVIPSGVDAPPAVVAPDTPPFALFVGRLSAEKGVDVLADAARDLPLVVIGDGPRRDLFPEGLGAVPPADVHAWYDRASVVVLPSRREGLGNVLLEAMAHGRPVVATDVGGIPSIVDHGRNGLLVPAGDADALSRAIRLLLEDRELGSRLGAAGRELVAARAGWDVVTSRTLDVYREAVERRPAADPGWRPVPHRV